MIRQIAIQVYTYSILCSQTLLQSPGKQVNHPGIDRQIDRQIICFIYLNKIYVFNDFYNTFILQKISNICISGTVNTKTKQDSLFAKQNISPQIKTNTNNNKTGKNTLLPNVITDKMCFPDILKNYQDDKSPKKV